MSDPSDTTEMIRPHRCPDEGVPIEDFIGALNAFVEARAGSPWGLRPGAPTDPDVPN
jgi:hypothetical protein